MESTKTTFNIQDNFPYALGILAMIAVALISGSMSTAIKEGLLHFSTPVLFALRFLMAAIIFVPFVREFNLTIIRHGLILGLIAFARFACQTIGLETVPANQGSFFFSLSIVFVTLFDLFFRKRFSTISILASALAFGGIIIMSWQGQVHLTGNLWLIASAMFDTVNLLLLERIARTHSSVALTGIRLWVIAILGSIWAFPQISKELPAIEESWGVLLYLGIVATGIMFWLYTFAMQRIQAQDSAIIGTLEPIIGAIIAFLLLGETLTIKGFIGAAMVISALVLVVIRFNSEQESSEVSPTTDSPDLAKTA